VIRTATTDDLPLVRELWQAFEAEVPDADWRDDDSEQDLAALEKAIGEGIVLLDDDVGLAVAMKRGSRLGFLDVVYVKPEARGKDVAAGLVREAARRLGEQGADMLELEVLHSNERARGVYEHWGFAPVEHLLAARIDALVNRLDPSAHGPTFGSVYVQTDDAGAVERAVRKFLPRLGHSDETDVTRTGNGWVRVRDDLADRDPDVLHQLARELSFASEAVVLALGLEEGSLVRYTLYDRGTTMDEYWSVPEYRGPLPPGDVIALSANPRVVARLTGADPARVRSVARTATSPDELPPAPELHAQIAELMGVEV
jgi:ribosomal protein S18 acetylase RimI-like enzyme